MFFDLIANKVLVISVCAWAAAQFTKVFTVLIKEKRFDVRYFVIGGGMPSSHSSTVCALATSVAMINGLDSVTFALAAIVAIIVMYDAAGVRRSVGRQARILNRIMHEFRFRRPIADMERDLREFIGHTPFQVIIGGLMGVLIAWLWITISGI